MIGAGLFDIYLQMTSGIISSVASKRTAVLLGMVFSALGTVGLGLIPIALGMLLFGIGSISLIDIALSLAAGILLAFGFIMRYMSLYTEQITNVSILGQLQSAVVVLAGIFLFQESIDVLSISGMAMILVGSLFVLANSKFEINRRLIPIVFGSTSWGVYWIFIIYSFIGTGNFLLPLFIARAFATLILLAFLFFSKDSMKEGAKSLRLLKAKRLLVTGLIFVLIAGLGNGLGDALFGLVASLKIAAIGSAISTSLGLIIIAVIAYFMYKERLSGMDKIGFVIMLIGAFLLSLG